VTNILRTGEHAGDFDPLPEGPPGTLGNPLVTMPDDVPYGAWFRCAKCGRLARSTIAFDCHGGPGELLTCEACLHGGLEP
jgi:hypothetical protein